MTPPLNMSIFFERDSFWEIQLSLDLDTNWFRTFTSMKIFHYLNFLHHGYTSKYSSNSDFF